MFRALLLALVASTVTASAQQPALLTLGQQKCVQDAADHVAFEQRLLAKIEQQIARAAQIEEELKRLANEKAP